MVMDIMALPVLLILLLFNVEQPAATINLVTEVLLDMRLILMQAR